MRIVENIQPVPPPPPRTFDLMDVTEEDLKLLRHAMGASSAPTERMWDIYVQLNKAIAD